MTRGAAALAVLAALSLPLPAPAAPPPAPGAWVPLPRPLPEGVWITDFAVDRAGRPWCLGGNRVLRLDGEGWTDLSAPPDPRFLGDGNAALVGGPDRGLYLTQVGPDERTGSLFSLDGKEPAPLGQFYRESPRDPGLFVASDGTLVNFGARYLAVLRGGKWESREVSVGSPESVAVTEFAPGGPICFHRPDGTFALLHGDGRFEAAPLPDLPGAGGPPAWSPVLHPLDGERALLGDTSPAGRTALLRLEPEGFTLDEGATAALAAALGGKGRLADAAPDGAGGAWVLVLGMPGVPYAPGGALYRMDPAGGLRPVTLPDGRPVTQDDPRSFSRRPRSLLPGGEGPAWFATEEDGLLRLRDGGAEPHDARRGVAPAGLRWVEGPPAGPPYAASARGQVFRWDPAASPPEGFAGDWAKVPLRWPPLEGPDGVLWMQRTDREGGVVGWTGSSWREVPGSAVPLAADGGGGLLARGVHGGFVVHRAGRTETRATLEEAVPALLAGGRSRFSRGGEVQVARGGGGEGWCLDVRGRRLLRFGEGRVDVFEGRGFSLLDPGAPGEGPFLLDEVRWWTLREGRIQGVPSRPPGLDPRVLGGLPDRRMPIPFQPGLSEGFHRAVLLLLPGGPNLPVARGEAERAAAEKRAPRPAALRDLGIPRVPGPGTVHSMVDHRRSPALPPVREVFPDGDGGTWVRAMEPGGPRLVDGAWLRLRGDAAFTADFTGTPLEGRDLAGVATDASGRPWFLVQRRDGLDAWFFRGGGPVLRNARATVVRGRRVVFAADPDSAVSFLERRLHPLGAWRLDRAEGGAVFDAVEPGARRLTFDLRGYGPLGVAGPAVRVAAEVDPRFPSLRWAGGAAPRAVNDPRWRVPVEAAWAFPEEERRVEVRFDGGPWLPLDGDGTALVARLNNRSVAVEVRALEEGAFASPVLAATVAVEMNLEPWLRGRITAAKGGDGGALGDLRTVPVEALRVLEAMAAESGNRGSFVPLLLQLREGWR